MKRYFKPLVLVILIFCIVSVSGCFEPEKEKEDETPRAEIIVKDHGTFIIKLFPELSPLTVNNFIKYTQDGFYDGLIFHRVIEGFMIQGGGFEPDMKSVDATYEPIKNEARDSGLSNNKYTIAMARTSDPDSATSQFFINTVNNPFLDPSGSEAGGAGYAVFGEVISGFSVVDEIEKVETTKVDGYDDVPVDDVVIESVTIVYISE